MREKKPVNIRVGANIQQAREATGYTQEALAEELGVTPNHLSAIERGVSGPSLETLCRLCCLLGTSADRLLFGQSADDDTTYELARRLQELDPDKVSHIQAIITSLLALANR